MSPAGPADLVRCYHCGLGLKDWGPMEDPILEHVRFSPQCLHLADNVIREQLDQYRVRHGSVYTQVYRPFSSVDWLILANQV